MVLNKLASIAMKPCCALRPTADCWCDT